MSLGTLVLSLFSIYGHRGFHSNQLFFFELRFPYLDPPEERFILDALKQLYQFDAIDRSGLWFCQHNTVSFRCVIGVCFVLCVLIVGGVELLS